MSSTERRPLVRSSEGEPASSGRDGRVPPVAAWQSAAETGAAARDAVVRAGAASGASASAWLSETLRAEVVDWCRGGLPNEACGLLVADRVHGEGGVPARFVGMRNVAASPFRYLMDPDEQLRVMLEIDDADEVVWGIVHSHVSAPAVPSATDVGLAAYPDSLYVLCSLAEEPPLIRAWTIMAGAVDEVLLEVT